MLKTDQMKPSDNVIVLSGACPPVGNKLDAFDGALITVGIELVLVILAITLWGGLNTLIDKRIREKEGPNA